MRRIVLSVRVALSWNNDVDDDDDDDADDDDDDADLSRKKSFGGTAGMAFVSTVCSRSHGVGINAVRYFLF